MLLNLECGKLKGLGELTRILNASEGDVRLDIERGGSACLPIFLRCMVA